MGPQGSYYPPLVRRGSLIPPRSLPTSILTMPSRPPSPCRSFHCVPGAQEAQPLSRSTPATPWVTHTLQLNRAGLGLLLLGIRGRLPNLGPLWTPSVALSVGLWFSECSDDGCLSSSGSREITSSGGDRGSPGRDSIHSAQYKQPGSPQPCFWRPRSQRDHLYWKARSFSFLSVPLIPVHCSFSQEPCALLLGQVGGHRGRG